MKKNRVIGLVFALLAPIFMMAQDPHINVSAKQQVMVGERFNVAFEVNAEGKNFKAPSFNGFSVIGGPMNSRSTSMRSINGSTTITVSNTYTYILMADAEGDFTIGSASIEVDGNVVKSEPYAIKVVAGNASSAPTAQGGQQPSGQQQSNTNDPKVNGQDLFLRANLSKKSVFVGEPIVLTYKLYTRVPVSITAAPKMPSLSGFWTKECESQRQSTEMVNGVQYETYEVYKTVLIPQKTGSFTIDPMVLECMAQVVTQSNNSLGYDPFGFFNDPFFNQRITNVPKTLRTPAVNLEVKSLPEKDRPDSFDGAVGSYNFTASADKNELNTNDAFVLTLTLSGSGNIELVNLPEPLFPPDFDANDPIVTSSVDVNGQGMSGTIKAEYTVIPRRAGDFTIPPVEFSYYNTSQGKYETLVTSAMDFKVTKGANDDSEDGGLYSANQGDIKRLGSDIRDIHTGSPRLKAVHTHFFASSAYFVILVALLLVFLLALFLVKKRRQFKQDVVLVRNKRATRVAKGRLKNAYKFLKAGDQNHFYEEMSQALWGYISDKLSIERSVLSMESVQGAMMDKGIDETISNEFVDTLNTCEFARFAPGDAAAKMQELYERGMQTIMKVEKSI